VRATEIATAVAGEIGIPVLGWALPEAIAAQLNDEFAATFVGRHREEIDLSVEVDRSASTGRSVVMPSQSSENPCSGADWSFKAIGRFSDGWIRDTRWSVANRPHDHHSGDRGRSDEQSELDQSSGAGIMGCDGIAGNNPRGY